MQRTATNINRGSARDPSSIGHGAARTRARVCDARAAYPLRVDPVVRTQYAELTASDGATNDELGYSVAVSGGTAIVGAYRHAPGGPPEPQG